MATSQSDILSKRRLKYVPKFNFQFVDDYVRSKFKCKGEDTINKGLKYFVEGYIAQIQAEEEEDGCTLRGLVYKSYRKNDAPNQVEVHLEVTNGIISVKKASCKCENGKLAACSHVTALLYKFSYMKANGMTIIPSDIAKTSQPQSWHVPRGPRITGQAVQEVAVHGHGHLKEVRDGKEVSSRAKSGIKSTLSDPVRIPPPPTHALVDAITAALPECMALPCLKAAQTAQPTVQTKFGLAIKGSPISYQQALQREHFINNFDDMVFPDLPMRNVMINEVPHVLTENQQELFESIHLTREEITYFEEQTRLQSGSKLWHQLRAERITASSVGMIFKRIKQDMEKFLTRLTSTHSRTTAIMRWGHDEEGNAAKKYSEVMNHTINIYPSGVIISKESPWIAASPDRKVYNPARTPSVGLAEFKCSTKDDLSEIDYLIDIIVIQTDDQGLAIFDPAGFAVTTEEKLLDQNHNHFYQVMTQLAVTGLEWCDFFVYCPSTQIYHLETIYFDATKWQEIKNKIDAFYFNHFIAFDRNAAKKVADDEEAANAIQPDGNDGT